MLNVLSEAVLERQDNIYYETKKKDQFKNGFNKLEFKNYEM